MYVSLLDICCTEFSMKNIIETPPPIQHNFIPKEFPSIKDNHHGISRTVFTHMSRLREMLSDWMRVVNEGCKLCKSISALKLHECSEGYFPPALKSLAASLVEALTSLEHILEGVKMINNQMNALAQLQPSDEPVIHTWSASKISDTVTNICNSLCKEFKLKQIVIENLAFCRDEDTTEVYVSTWEFDVYMNIRSDSAYLFTEVGLSSIS